MHIIILCKFSEFRAVIPKKDLHDKETRVEIRLMHALFDIFQHTISLFITTCTAVKRPIRMCLVFCSCPCSCYHLDEFFNSYFQGSILTSVELTSAFTMDTSCRIFVCLPTCYQPLKLGYLRQEHRSFRTRTTQLPHGAQHVSSLASCPLHAFAYSRTPLMEYLTEFV